MDHGEVFTSKREVSAILDLVKQETERIESRFLEPACGTGNFLTEILERKLRVVSSRYGKSQLDYERYAVLAVSSVYGIDILEDNVVECRKRLFDIFDHKYTSLFKEAAKEGCRNTVKYILTRNIIWGDALDLKTVSENPQPIVFSEWSPVNGSMIEVIHDLDEDEKCCSLCGLPFRLFPATQDSEDIHYEIRLIRRIHKRKCYVSVCHCQVYMFA